MMALNPAKTLLTDGFFAMALVNLQRQQLKSDDTISTKTLLPLQKRCSDLAKNMLQPHILKTVRSDRSLSQEYDLLQRTLLMQRGKIELLSKKMILSTKPLAPSEEVQLLTKAVSALKQGGKTEACFNAIRTLKSKNPQIAKSLFGHVWHLAGSPMPPSTKAHPKFGEVAFFNKEGRSVSSDIRRKAIEAVLKDLGKSTVSPKASASESKKPLPVKHHREMKDDKDSIPTSKIKARPAVYSSQHTAPMKLRSSPSRVEVKSSDHRNVNSAKVKLIKEQLAKQLKLFEHWASKKDWKMFTPQHSHYDWWMFPVMRPSSGYGTTYAVSQHDIDALKTDQKFMDNYQRGVELVIASWGWDLQNDCAVPSSQRTSEQKWTGYGVRLGKMADSLHLFKEKELYKKVQIFFQSVCTPKLKQYPLESWVIGACSRGSPPKATQPSSRSPVVDDEPSNCSVQ